MMKNEFGQLQAKLNLNIEAEPAPSPAAAATAAGGAAPAFVEKPKIVTKEEGKLIMLIVKYRAESMCELLWSFKETRIVETKTIRIVHERIEDYFEARLELTVDTLSWILSPLSIRSTCIPTNPHALSFSRNPCTSTNKPIFTFHQDTFYHIVNNRCSDNVQTPRLIYLDNNQLGKWVAG
jgi:hypothetical protein